jgi:chromosome segregation ATPase
MTLHIPVQYQKDGFGRPFFLVQCHSNFAKISPHRSRKMKHQAVIERCGTEYTNAPRDMTQCERLTEQAVTVISGLRPSSARTSVMADAPGVDELRTKTEPARPVTALQGERDVQARTILDQELQRVQKQHQGLVQEYKQGAPVKWASEQAAPHKYQDRVTALKAAIDRAERDIDSLQRELAHRPLAMKTLKP